MAKLVLIVDDDPTQRRILEETIKRLGYDTKTAQGGEQALKILDSPDKSAIALVLLDLVMPGLDGMEVLRRIAPKPGSPPVIVQTAHGSIDTAIAAMRTGAGAFGSFSPARHSTGTAILGRLARSSKATRQRTAAR